MIILNLLTCFNLVLMFCLLFFRKDNVLPNRILALIMLDPAINLASNINLLSGNLEKLPYTYFFAQITAYFFAPLVHMYVRLLMGKPINWKYPLYSFTIITILPAIYFAYDFSLLNDHDQHMYLSGVLNGPYPDAMSITNGIFIIMQQVYFTIAAIEVLRYRKKLGNTVSDYSPTKIQYLTAFITLIWVLNLITIALYATLPPMDVEYLYIPIVLTLIYSFILYFSLHYNSIFTGKSYEDFVGTNEGMIQASVDEPPEKVTDEATLRQIMNQVDNSFARSSKFTDAGLTLSMLATEIGVPARKLSAAINSVCGKNFYDFINEKRIERSMDLLQHQKHFTIEAVAQDSGFRSRSAFYRAFKKHTGQTPVEYQETILSRKSPQTP